jgi:hypothetical protein
MVAIPITNVTELQAIDGYAVDVSYYLANDIDASDTINWNGGLGFKPITPPFPYTAVLNFDGRGHTIKDLYINRPTESIVGLFARCAGTAVVADVFLENVYVHGKLSVGSLCGIGLGSIMNCGVKSGSVKSYSYTTNYGCGGLIGTLIAGSTITKSYSKANVESVATWGNGGLVGINNGTITDCYAMGTVSMTAYVPNYTGGLVGQNKGTIDKCYSNGAIISPSNTYCNGFVGKNTGAITASYWDTETSGYTKGTEPVSDPPTGKTTAQMKQEATFAGWDFCRTWKIIEGVTYPELRTGKKKQRVRRSS